MKIKITIAELILITSMFLAVISATPTYGQTPVPSPPQIAAESYILLDPASGTTLAEKNADKRLPPASLTKMMTAYLVEEELRRGNIDRESIVTVSEKAWRMKGSLMFIEVGEQVSVGDLLKGVIIVSGNDASVALAEYIAGSEDVFAVMMNNQAKSFDMKNTHMVNASGWPAKNHFSTARDLGILAQHMINDHADYYHIYAEKEFQYGVDKRSGKPLEPQSNRNTLLFTNPSVDGIKTGYSDEAGYCLVASSSRDGRRLIVAIMGAKNERSRSNEAQKLLTYGFRFYENVELKKGGVTLENASVWGGKTDTVSVGLDKDLIVTLPKFGNHDIKSNILLDRDIIAPISIGTQIGKVEVLIDNEIITTKPLLALEPVEKGGLFKRLFDNIFRFFTNLLH